MQIKTDQLAKEVTDVPKWIEQDINGYDIAAIQQGGCDSGAYMPAVTYHVANETMAKHGDDVFEYIQDIYGEMPMVDCRSWTEMATYYLSVAVEAWASQFGVEEEG